MNDPTPNVDLLDQVLERVHKLAALTEEYGHCGYPQHAAQLDGHDVWDQSLWLSRSEWMDREGCGTAACFAGWAVMLADETEPTEDTEIGSRARSLLGLTDFEARQLFHAANGLDELDEKVQGIKEGRYR